VNNEQQKAAENEDAGTEVSRDEGQETARPEPGAEAAEHAAAEDAGSADADASDESADSEEPEVIIARLRDELDAAKDATLRAAAEAQNARRRAEQDVEKARKFALERFAGDLLPVVDNLERALQAASEAPDANAIAEGVDLTLRSLLEVLGRYNIEQLDPGGEPFDPQLHEAMTMVPNPELEPNTVMDVMQKGFTLNGRLLRPARVVVSKAAE
jgi:molecular chaperone GrpE